MSDDLIRRSDAIKAVGKVDDYGDGIGFEVRSHCLVELELVPSADRPQGWIPCRERMPKKEEATYLICTETGHMCSCRWTQDIYGLGATKWSEWGWHRLDVPQYSKVVAWMPLKPWKGADDE